MGALYMVGGMVALVVVMAIVGPLIITLMSLPGTGIYLALKRSTLGTLAGSVLALVGQFYALAAIAAYIVVLARYVIAEHDGWPWAVWPIAVVGFLVGTATGGREAAAAEEANPELKRHPIYLVHGATWLLAGLMFFVFAVFPVAAWPLWSWLPGL